MNEVRKQSAFFRCQIALSCLRAMTTTGLADFCRAPSKFWLSLGLY